MAYRETVREMCVQYLLQKFRTMTDSESEDTSLLFRTVKRGIIDEGDMDVAHMPTVAVDEGEDQIVNFISTVEEHQLEVLVQFLFPAPTEADVDPRHVFNYYLGVIVRELYADRYLGGNAVAIRYTGNMIEIDDGVDPMPGGTIKFELLYRHLQSDPFKKP